MRKEETMNMRTMDPKGAKKDIHSSLKASALALELYMLINRRKSYEIRHCEGVPCVVEKHGAYEPQHGDVAEEQGPSDVTRG